MNRTVSFFCRSLKCEITAEKQKDVWNHLKAEFYWTWYVLPRLQFFAKKRTPAVRSRSCQKTKNKKAGIATEFYISIASTTKPKTEASMTSSDCEIIRNVALKDDSDLTNIDFQVKASSKLLVWIQVNESFFNVDLRFQRRRIVVIAHGDWQNRRWITIILLFCYFLHLLRRISIVPDLGVNALFGRITLKWINYFKWKLKSKWIFHFFTRKI